MLGDLRSKLRERIQNSESGIEKSRFGDLIKTKGHIRECGPFVLYMSSIKVADMLYDLFQLAHHLVYFFFGVVLTEGKTNGNLVGIVVDSADDV